MRRRAQIGRADPRRNSYPLSSGRRVLQHNLRIAALARGPTAMPAKGRNQSRALTPRGRLRSSVGYDAAEANARLGRVGTPRRPRASWRPSVFCKMLSRAVLFRPPTEHVRPVPTLTGHCGSPPWTSQSGGEFAYRGCLGKDRSPCRSRHSFASTK
jgi:hypothetical protein